MHVNSLLVNEMIYPSYKRPIERINDKLYIIHAIIPIDRIRNVKGVKDWLGCNTAFKVAREGNYWFCDEIEEADWEYVN
tara:strand:+ start:778 stop:1014 length:237 start_codon:yes stop_codon:yes gene_type:complete